eukprot:6638358-Prymnesium_polylepis.1
MATNALQPGHRGRHFVVSCGCPTLSSVWPPGGASGRCAESLPTALQISVTLQVMCRLPPFTV